jgi:secondary thiamine-phosphate synthase enzyme
MIVRHYEVALTTRPRALLDISDEVRRRVRDSRVAQGLCSVFIRHTSASLVIQENADPAVLRDLARWFGELAPESRAWEHDAEGPDDMPAHARAALTRSTENVPVIDGRLALGTWQAIYLWEHRARPHERRVVITIVGTEG